MVFGVTLGKEFISDVSFRITHMAYLANWPPLAILNNRRIRRRRGGGGGGHPLKNMSMYLIRAKS